MWIGYRYPHISFFPVKRLACFNQQGSFDRQSRRDCYNFSGYPCQQRQQNGSPAEAAKRIRHPEVFQVLGVEVQVFRTEAEERVRALAVVTSFCPNQAPAPDGHGQLQPRSAR